MSVYLIILDHFTWVSSASAQKLVLKMDRKWKSSKPIM